MGEKLGQSDGKGLGFETCSRVNSMRCCCCEPHMATVLLLGLFGVCFACASDLRISSCGAPLNAIHVLPSLGIHNLHMSCLQLKGRQIQLAFFFSHVQQNCYDQVDRFLAVPRLGSRRNLVH